MSKLKEGDYAVINFGHAGMIHGVVCAVKHTEGVVYYDIKVFPFPNEEENKHIFSVLRDVRGYFVESPDARFNCNSNMGIVIIEN